MFGLPFCNLAELLILQSLPNNCAINKTHSVFCRNSLPPTTTVGNFLEKMNSVRDKCWIDVGFWGGVVPGNQV